MRGEFRGIGWLLGVALVASAAWPSFAWAFCLPGQKPETLITSGPSGTVASTSATFEFVWVACSGSFTCKLDGTPLSAWTSCTSPKLYTGLSQGAHTFQVRATGVNGTDPSPAIGTWTVDTIAPDTSITAGPGFTSDTTPTFSFTSTEGGGSFTCKVDGGSYSSCINPITLGVQS